MKEEEERKKQLVVSALEWIAFAATAAACCFCGLFCFVFGWRRDGPKGRRGKGFFVAIASFPRKRGRGREDFGASEGKVFSRSSVGRARYIRRAFLRPTHYKATRKVSEGIEGPLGDICQLSGGFGGRKEEKRTE